MAKVYISLLIFCYFDKEMFLVVYLRRSRWKNLGKVESNISAHPQKLYFEELTKHYEGPGVYIIAQNELGSSHVSCL